MFSKHTRRSGRTNKQRVATKIERLKAGDKWERNRSLLGSVAGLAVGIRSAIEARHDLPITDQLAHMFFAVLFLGLATVAAVQLGVYVFHRGRR